jgi:hypothetical protein
MRIIRIMAALLLAALSIGGATAKEGGDQYPHGAESWVAGALPPPGTYFLNYFGYYEGKLRDGDGDKVPNTRARAWFDAMRFVHVTNTKLLGGDWAVQTIVPIVHQTLKLGGDGKTVTGLGDVLFSPLVIGWHAGDLHWVFALDFFAPTGKYESGEPTKSIGANYWSVEPVLAVTWLPPSGWEVSAKFMYNIKSENEDFRSAKGAPRMDYQSGDELHIDFLVGKRFGPWGAGLAGYYVKQTTDDELDGDKLSSALGPWSGGRRGEAFAIGPSVSYTTKGGTLLIAQWQHETQAENRFRGDKAWFRLVTPF